MATGQTLLGKMLGRLFFRHATATSVHEVSAHFRRVEFRGEALRNAGWAAGDKVQVFLQDIGMRTYTPLSWHEARGTTEFLLYAHGDGPGSRWTRGIRQGDACQFFGPRRSLSVREDEPIFLVGDETAFAVAHAFKASMRAGSVHAAFEVTSRPEAEGVLRQVGLADAECFERTPEDLHLDGVCGSIRRAVAARPDTRLVLTGRAQSIQWIRARLKRDGLRAPSTVKPYWSVGKRGLD
ncbi:siderophore-interacting protein [Pendulispora rubella]|uniref:Siderophore-interacting protein n=1 Tax=Pendulispora rubella TaxID=2741070 RepID=A0ABZ2L9K2_9BACT